MYQALFSLPQGFCIPLGASLAHIIERAILLWCKGKPELSNIRWTLLPAHALVLPEPCQLDIFSKMKTEKIFQNVHRCPIFLVFQPIIFFDFNFHFWVLWSARDNQTSETVKKCHKNVSKTVKKCQQIAPKKCQKVSKSINLFYTFPFLVSCWTSYFSLL